MSRLVLASASPRRKKLLKTLRLDFLCLPSHIEEEDYRNLPPAERVVALARAKAEKVAGSFSDALVLGADTLVVCQGQVMGKPGSPEEAEAMLSFLSGRVHEVYTGVAVVKVPEMMWRQAWERTEVCFRPLTPREIKAYVATGEPLDKAGAYGIQGLGALMVESICGDFFNVVGLPLVRTVALLEELGFDPWEKTWRRPGDKADGRMPAGKG